MTLDEAKKVADVIATADEGCAICVDNLCERMTAAFPQFQFARSDDGLMIQPAWSDHPDDAVCAVVVTEVEA